MFQTTCVSYAMLKFETLQNYVFLTGYILQHLLYKT